MHRASWKRIGLWLIVALAGGCSPGPFNEAAVIPVAALDEQAVFDGKALILVNLNTGTAEQVKPDVVEKCVCGGTGRSGDGLGPCACAPTCSCKKKAADVPAEVPLPQEVEKTEESEDESSTFEEVNTEIADNIERLVKVGEDLAANQLKMAETLKDHEARLKTIEEAETSGVTKTGFNVGDVKKAVRVRAVVVFQNGCKSCDRMDAIFPTLREKGWIIGDDGDDSHILRVNRYAKVESMIAADAIRRTYRTPTTVFYHNGEYVRAIEGEMSARMIADIVNEIETKK